MPSVFDGERARLWFSIERASEALFGHGRMVRLELPNEERSFCPIV
jgi:hypothetical protein